MGENTELLTIGDLIERLQLSRTSIYKLINKGLPSIMIGRSRRFRLEPVMNWIEGLNDKPAKKPAKKPVAKYEPIDIPVERAFSLHDLMDSEAITLDELYNILSDKGLNHKESRLFLYISKRIQESGVLIETQSETGRNVGAPRGTVKTWLENICEKGLIHKEIVKHPETHKSTSAYYIVEKEFKDLIS